MASNKQRKSRGTILGLALMAMLAFGALSAGAAQATPQWSINGKAFAGTETFLAKSSATVPIPIVSFKFWGMQFDCDVKGTGTMVGGTGGGEATFSFTSCKSPVPSACTMADFGTQKLKVELVNVSGNVSEKFTPASGTGVIGQVQLGGAECSVGNSWSLNGSFAAWFNPKQKPLLPTAEPALRFSGAESGASMSMGGTGVALSGDFRQLLSGANTGYSWWWMA